MGQGILQAIPKFKAFDSDGDPLSGGKLYTYESGTSTPKATYSDRALTTPNANPIVLDSDGEAVVYMDRGAYKFVLKDSDDVTQWTFDNLYGYSELDNMITTKGDIIQGGTDGIPERAAIGSQDQVWTVLASGKGGWSSSAGTTVTLTNASGEQLQANDVVALLSTADESVELTTEQGDTRQIFIVSDATIENGASGLFQQIGLATVSVDGDVTRGNFLRTSTTSGKAEDAGADPYTVGVFAIATTDSAAGVCTAILLGRAEGTFHSAYIPAHNYQAYNKNIYGDGSDGDTTISTNTTLADSTVGIKVMQYENLTVDAGIYLEGHANDEVLVIMVSDTLTLNGTIRQNGRGGAGGAATGNPGALGAAGGGGGGNNGGGGGGGGQAGEDHAIDGTANGGGNGPNSTIVIKDFPLEDGGFCTGQGGEGGNAGHSYVGQDGACYIPTPQNPISFEIARTRFGAGGGCGGGGTPGAGGAGGGVLIIAAKTIVWGASGVASANGADGSNSATGGGGGGGGGGFAQVVYDSSTGSSDIQVTGGSGGTGVTSYNGGDGEDGVSGEFEIR